MTLLFAVILGISLLITSTGIMLCLTAGGIVSASIPLESNMTNQTNSTNDFINGTLNGSSIRNNTVTIF
ncbi:MAG TPA: hypothetical protein VF884_14475 [Nitrososphaeraceae archaeon]